MKFKEKFYQKFKMEQMEYETAFFGDFLKLFSIKFSKLFLGIFK